MNTSSPARPVVFDIDAHPPLLPLPVDHIGDMSVRLFFDRLSRAGVGMLCGRLTPPAGFFERYTPEEAISLLNRGAMDLSASESRYLPALWIHPDCPDGSIAQLEEHASCGARLVGVDARHLSHSSIAPILDRAQALNLTVCLHGESLSQAEALAAQHTSLHMLIGGIGSTGYMPEPAFHLMQAHPNLSLNLSGIIWAGNYVMHEWAERIGIKRLFFGTGYPFCNPAGHIAALRWELRDQPDSVSERIFFHNALALTGAEGRL